MKRMLSQALCLLLAVCLCCSAAACGGRGVGGLGTLDMDDGGTGGTGGIGTLGKPTAPPEPGETDAPAESSEPTAVPTPAPTPVATPQTPALRTEVYENEYFSMTIPAGWTVEYDIWEPEYTGNFYLFVRDPANRHNCLFFVETLQPFFDSESAKKAFLPYTDGSLNSVPVLREISASALMGGWTGVYETTQTQGFTNIENFQLSNITSEETGNTTADGATQSYALGAGTIAGASGQYSMYLFCVLQHMDAVPGLPAESDYYISFGNTGLWLSDENGDLLETLLTCLNSLDMSGYINAKS